MNQQNTAKNKQEASWQYEFDKRQERKQSKEYRRMRKHRRVNHWEGV